MNVKMINVMRYKALWLVVLCFGIGASRLVGQDSPNTSGGPLLADQAAYDVEHCDLALVVSPAERRIDGRLTLTARVTLAPLAVLVLDLDERLTVTRVERHGAPLSFEHRGGRIHVALDPPATTEDGLRVTIHYGGEPRVAPSPPWVGGFVWSETDDGRPWIATACQAEGADLWWPCKDHPSDKPERMDLRITVPAGLYCAANGVLVSRVREGDQESFHWHVANPVSNYNVALAIGPYEELTTRFESASGVRVPVHFWVLPGHAEDGRRLLDEILDHLAFFEEIGGPYPFRNEKYGVVETPHLGMEHQTIIAYGNRFRRQPFNYDWLHLHEAAHEYWANLVTCRDWKDMWLHEGFAAYMQALYLERRRGPEVYRAEMANKLRSIRHRRPIAPREPQTTREIYFGGSGASDNDLYDKGAWVLHTLRWQVGDDTFFRILRRFAYPTAEAERTLDGTQVRFVDTEDFIRTATEVAEADLSWFFEVYVRQAAAPRLVVTRTADGVELQWETCVGSRFSLDVPIRVGEEVHRVPMTGGLGQLAIPVGDEPIVDPDRRILMKIAR